MLSLLLIGLSAAAAENTVINFNFEGLLAGLTAPSGPTEGPSPTPMPTILPTMPSLLPIPASAKGPAPINQSAYDGNYYYYEQIGAGVYWATNTIYNGMFIIASEGVWVFDVPGLWMYSAIKDATRLNKQNITRIVYTHSHIDHIGGAGGLIATAQAEGRLSPTFQILGSTDTKNHLTKMADTNRPVPTSLITGTPDSPNYFGLSGGTLNVVIFALSVTGHLDGSLVIWIPAVNTLMTVDVAFPGWAPFYRMGMAADIESLDSVYATILGYPFTKFVGGHLGRPGTKAEVQQQQEYLHSLVDYAAQGNAMATSAVLGASFAAAGDNAWYALQLLFKVINDKCTELLLARWGGVLAAVDVTGPDHCWMMTEHLRIN